MKLENPYLDTLRWVLLGGLIGLILYIGHRLLLHEEEKVDDHSAHFSQSDQRLTAVAAPGVERLLNRRGR